MAFNYNRIGADGRLYFYYGIGQTWRVDTIADLIIRVERCTHTRSGTGDGVQYYLISKNGMIEPKPISAARLHYMLYCYGEYAVEVSAGTPQQLPLMIFETERYFKLNGGNLKCPICGGKGIKSDKFGAMTNCARCTLAIQEEIKDYMAKVRLSELINKV